MSIPIDDRRTLISKIRRDVLCILDNTDENRQDTKKRVEAYFSELVYPVTNVESEESTVTRPHVTESKLPETTKQLSKKNLLKLDKYIGRKFYVTQHMLQFRQDHPGLTCSEATKALVGQWKALTENTRNLYEIKASISKVLKDVNVDINP